MENQKISRKYDNTENMEIRKNGNSQKTYDNVQSGINDPKNLNQPKPTDFDIFLPWACGQLSPDIYVMVTRAAQKKYVSNASQVKKLSLKRKKSNLTSATKQIRALDINEVDSEKSSHKSAESSVATSNVIDIVKLETVYDCNENLIQLNFLKNKLIPRKVMQIIALTVPYQKYLTSININGGLSMDTLYEMSKLLPNSQITELCFDGSFLSEANYHVLLKQSQLKHLSLARCTINDAVVKTIADQLKDPCPAATVLSALNLSTNRITDIGAKYLADMLRGNRQLCYLNLAGNMITDEGGISILDKLQKFPVEGQEVSASRVKYVAYLKEKNALVNKFMTELRMELFIHNKPKYQNKQKSIPKAKRESQPYNVTNIVTESKTQILQERAESLADNKLGVFDEPFSLNNTETRDGVLHCLGNNTLCWLNLAYNNLSYLSVKKLLEVLTVQASLNRTPRGLTKVVIEGNLMPVACEEYEKIYKLLDTDKKKTKMQSEFTSKNKSLILRSTALPHSPGK